jgi:hypothetical protein
MFIWDTGWAEDVQLIPSVEAATGPGQAPIGPGPGHDYQVYPLK